MSVVDPAAVFAALGDPLRLSLLAAMGAEGRSISVLAEGLPITRQGVSKHLAVLEASGLAARQKQGREVLWRGNAEALIAAQAALDRIGAGWDRKLARLKAHVEGGQGGSNP